MNKQKIVDFIDEAISGTENAMKKSDIDNAEQQIALNDSLIELKLIKKYLYQLDEPEKTEKERLPDYIIEELNSELFKGEDEDLVLNCFYRESFDRLYGKETFLSNKVLNWFVIKGNVTKLINAIRNGYEPYKQTVWVVRWGISYVTYFEVDSFSKWQVETSTNKDDAVKFKKTEAYEVARSIDGEVEEWSE